MPARAVSGEGATGEGATGEGATGEGATGTGERASTVWTAMHPSWRVPHPSGDSRAALSGLAPTHLAGDWTTLNRVRAAAVRGVRHRGPPPDS